MIIYITSLPFFITANRWIIARVLIGAPGRVVTGALPTRCCTGHWPRTAGRRSGLLSRCGAGRRRPAAAGSTPANQPRTPRWRPRGRRGSVAAARARPAAAICNSVGWPSGSPAPVPCGRRSCPTAGRPRRPRSADSTTGHLRRCPSFRPTGRCHGVGSPRPRRPPRSRRCTSCRGERCRL